uniref:MFS transporter n=1 Tax=Cupriavidus yeoncheonensis TaxID=1462994 RepID=UPI003F495CFE
MKKKYVLIGVSAAAFLGPFTQTVYTPSLPELRSVFQVDTLLINLTISLFTAILALSNFVVGPIADTKGRRVTALVGLTIYVLGSAVCLFAPSYSVFLSGRVLQATGISTGTLIAPAVIGDIYEPHERGRAMSSYQTLTFLGPVFGPVVGGLIAAHLQWRWAFGLLVVAGSAVLLYSSLLLKETRPRDLVPPKFRLSTFRRILADRAAFSLLLLGFSQFFGYYIFLVYLPTLLASLFSISMASRGFFFVPLTAGILIGINLGGRWQQHTPGAKIVALCSFGLSLGVLLLFLCLATQWMTIPLLVLFLLIFGVLLGTSLPVQTAMLVNLFKEERATAVGLYNFCRFTGAAAGPLVGGWVELVASTNVVFLMLGLLLTTSAWVVHRNLQRANHRRQQAGIT